MEWAYLEFIPPTSNDNKDIEECKNIEFTGRHVMKLIHITERTYYEKNNNTYTNDATLLQYYTRRSEDLKLVNTEQIYFLVIYISILLITFRRSMQIVLIDHVIKQLCMFPRH